MRLWVHTRSPLLLQSGGGVDIIEYRFHKGLLKKVTHLPVINDSEYSIKVFYERGKENERPAGGFSYNIIHF